MPGHQANRREVLYEGTNAGMVKEPSEGTREDAQALGQVLSWVGLGWVLPKGR